MRGITLSANEIEAAPPEIRRWLEREIACTIGRLTASEPTTRTPALSSSECDAEKAGECTPATTSQGVGKMDGAKAEAIRKLIAARAYELWESEGQPHGHDLINWRQAEQEIMSCVEDGERVAALTERPERPPESNAVP